jgi:hypothetical protein
LTFWPFSYIKRKREEYKQKIKEEVLAEVLPELVKRKQEMVSAAKGELSSARDEFMQDIDKRKKGMQAEVDGLSREVSRLGGRSDSAVKAAREVKKDSQRMSAVAESIGTEAEEAAKTRATLEELAGNIDAKLKEFVDVAVAQCTEKMGVLERELLGKLREDHRLNIEEGVDIINEKNSSRMGEWYKDVNAKVEEALQKLEEARKDYAESVKPLSEQVQAIRDQLDDNVRYLIETFTYIRQNVPLFAYAVQLSDQQKSLLRELFSEKYDGDLPKLRRDLREKRQELQGRRDLAPDELDLKYAESGINEMVGFVKRQKRNLRALLETVDRVENVYKRGSSGRNRRRQ